MKIRVLAKSQFNEYGKGGFGSYSTDHTMIAGNVKSLAGLSAGVCYMPSNLDALVKEDSETRFKRAEKTLVNKHHSVFGHGQVTLAIEDAPKILAMILNNEKIYNTSEKSGRYTEMWTVGLEKDYYERWIKIFEKRITEEYPKMPEKMRHKYALENARYLISISTPATTMIYTCSVQQLNYIYGWMKKWWDDASYRFQGVLDPLAMRIGKVFDEFTQQIEDLGLVVEGLEDPKDRTFSLFAERKRTEEFGENYCINYTGSFTQLAQAQRHRTLSYEFYIDAPFGVYVPKIIRGTEFEEKWENDAWDLFIETGDYPQGMLVNICERGTYDNFILKCKERLCSRAMLEIAQQTEATLVKYHDSVMTKYGDPCSADFNPALISQIGRPLEDRIGVARCMCPFNFECAEESACPFGPRHFVDRLI